tara:strand:+ start:725 stop:1258 length:534 start_codon:yes stop_codon:yes gene_type:complete
MSGYYNSRGDAGVPPGSISCYAGINSPSGWLLCNGGSYSTTEYAELFSIIGHRYGGSGTSFKVPDLKNLFVRGTSGTLSSTVKGNNSVNITLQVKNLPSHSHIYHDAYFAEVGGDLGNQGWAGSNWTDRDNSLYWRTSNGGYSSTKQYLNTTSTGGSKQFSLNVLPEYKIMNFIIKK